MFIFFIICEFFSSLSLLMNIPAKKNSRMKIHCFLINAARLKQLEQNSNQQTSSTLTNTNGTTNESNGSLSHRTNSDKTKRTKTTNESLKSISEETPTQSRYNKARKYDYYISYWVRCLVINFCNAKLGLNN